MDSPDASVRPERGPGSGVSGSCRDQSRGWLHGGGKAITRAMESSGLKGSLSKASGSRIRRPSRSWIRVLSREINPEVVAAIKSLGGQPEVSAALTIFKCRKAHASGPDGQRLDLGFVGEVTEVNTAPLLECIAQGVIPVISPTARGEDGKIYNCMRTLRRRKRPWL